MRTIGFCLCLIALGLALAGCGGQPSSYTPVGEMKGPGLLSGEDGEFVLYRR